MSDKTNNGVVIRELVDILKAKVLCGNELLNNRVQVGCTSDLMSDILTLDLEDILLVTGLTNLQTIRTAEFADVSCVVIVRNKKATQDMISLASESDIVLLECRYSAYKASYLVCEAGLIAVDDIQNL